MNFQFIIGNLGSEPDSRFDDVRKRLVTRLEVATNRFYKDRETGEKKKKTEWHKVVLRGNLAETAAQYLKKGSKAFFFGVPETRSYEQDGVTKYITELHVEKMELLDSAPFFDDEFVSEYRNEPAPAAETNEPATAQNTSTVPRSLRTH